MPRSAQRHQIPLHDLIAGGDAAATPESGDHILVVLGKNGVFETLLPHIFRVTQVNSAYSQP